MYRTVALLSLTVLCACGGGIAAPDKQSSGTSGTSGTSGGGITDSDGNTGASGGSTNGTTTTTSAICTPGAYVFCRCADRSEGTKLCREDGHSFDACTCGSDKPPPPPPCTYPPTNNPAGCPMTYSYTYQGQPCDTLNLQCSYPGAGDGESNGCNATAGLACRVSPGGAQSWVATQ